MQHKDRLTDEERKARRLESARKYREANKQKCVAASLASRAKKPEHYAEKKREQNRDPGYQERQRVYRAENRDRLNASTVEWQTKNPEKYAEYQLLYRQENAKAAADRARFWRKINPERSARNAKAWAAANPGLRAQSAHNRRARIASAGGVLSSGIYERLMEQQRGLCPCCRVDLSKTKTHLDHIMPISRGGDNSDMNVQLLCQSCNLQKHAKHPVDFMQERGFLL